MTSGRPALNLPPVEDADESWRPIGTRAHPDHIRLIDIAAAKLGKRRSHFILEAAIEKALALGADHAA